MAATEVEEVISFLRSDRPAVRRGAVEAVLGLTATAEGRSVLRGTQVAAHLRHLIGDTAAVAELAIKALVNLSADAALLDQILRAGVVNALMESLRDDACKHKRVIVMLLTNLSQTAEGCDQLLQRGDAGGGLMGLHLRRLIQWFVAPGPVGGGGKGRPSAAGGGEGDDFEYVASMLHNVTQVEEARRIVLEPERGIVPALLKQLRSGSTIRRRGVASMLRNCLFETEGRYVAYLLSPSVDVVTHLLWPLAGPDTYNAEDKALLHPSLTEAGAHKAREPDAATRRALVECVWLVLATKEGREHCRRVRVYPVIKALHQWLESPEHRGVNAEGEELPLEADDEATVSSIQHIVQQLFREDEVTHTSQVMSPATSTAPAPVSRGAIAGAGSTAPHVTPPESVHEVHDAMLRRGVKVLSLEDARAKAAAVSAGPADVTEEELSSFVTPVPDWSGGDDEVGAHGSAGMPPSTHTKATTTTAGAPNHTPPLITASKGTASTIATFNAVEAAGLGGVD